MRKKSTIKVEPAAFMAHLELHGIMAPEPEYKFIEARDWRFDFAWPGAKLALEIDGGIWSGGAHVRAARMLKTWEKENSAACLGWRILRCQPRSAMSSDIINLLMLALPKHYTGMNLLDTL